MIWSLQPPKYRNCSLVFHWFQSSKYQMYLNVNETPALPRNVTWCGAAPEGLNWTKHGGGRCDPICLYKQPRHSCCHDTSNYINYNTFPRVPPKKDCKHAICQHSAFIHKKNRWCPVNLGLVRKVMMDHMMGEFIDSSLDPKKPILI